MIAQPAKKPTRAKTDPRAILASWTKDFQEKGQIGLPPELEAEVRRRASEDGYSIGHHVAKLRTEALRAVASRFSGVATLEWNRRGPAAGWTGDPGPRSTPAQLAELRFQAISFAWTFPTPDQWRQFFDSELLPGLNRIGYWVARCQGCGQIFSRRDRRDLYCSTKCAARLRQARRRGTPPKRKRQKDGDALSRDRVFLDSQPGWEPVATEEFRLGDDSTSSLVASLAQRDGPGAILEALADKMDAEGKQRRGQILRNAVKDLQKIA